jgi:pimeloyl-ACP methyl ester carboxylesterase
MPFTLYTMLPLIVSMVLAGWNDWECKPTPAHPRPVILVHGRGGTIDGFDTLVTALTSEGYCVFGTNYGQVGGTGQYGVDHLWYSAAQIEVFARQVMDATGATHVDMVGHSAGTGVIANLILARGGDTYVYRAVSFAGLHHPYAHAGAAGYLDNDLFLPNTPPEMFVLARAAVAGADPETVNSNFVTDLFDPVYWTMLHGGLSESPGTYMKLVTQGRSIPTRDASPSICYTNIVGIADLLAGPSAGFQDPRPNIDNFLLQTASDHAQILADPIAITKTLEALGTSCAFTGTTDPVDPDDPGDAPEDPDAEPDEGDGGMAVGGCNAAGDSSGALVGLLLALALLTTRGCTPGVSRRRR